MPSALPDSLRQLSQALDRREPRAASECQALQRVKERLERDLLPRTRGGAGHLVVGIVGPNNAGKSALFNALVGLDLSPSLPTGGATRRLVGALSPELLVTLEGHPAGSGLRLKRPAEPGGADRRALELSADPAELLAFEVPNLPTGLLLVDTPDFDSVAQENRAASEALLQTVDLALVVVTRHTYQNAEVVLFLQRWLAHGRPWVLVYNEAIDPGTTREHGEKLAADVGSPPLAVFSSGFDVEVARGLAKLDPCQLEAPHGSLGTWLYDGPQRERLKAAALSSSLGQLSDDWRAFLGEERATAEERASLREQAERLARDTGQRVAHEAMPMGPFLLAFRAVLDRRPGLLPSSYRGLLGKARGLAVKGLRRLPWAGEKLRSTSGPGEALVEAERAVLAPAWAPFYTELAELLDKGEAAAWRQSLAAVLGPAQLVPAGERAKERLAEDQAVLQEFQLACEERIEAELDGRRDQWLLQAAVDTMHLLPAAVAGLVIVKTGGLGADVAVGGAGAVTTLLSERLSRLLGSGVAAAARDRWSQLRGEALGQLLLECALGDRWQDFLRSEAEIQERLNNWEPLGAFLNVERP